MDDDDFGDLYGNEAPALPSIGSSDVQNSFSNYAFFDDDDIDEKKTGPALCNAPLSVSTKPQPTPKLLHVPDEPADKDSDEDDDMLLLGYSSKSGSGASKPQASTSMVSNHEDEAVGKQRVMAENTDEDGSLSPPVSSTKAAAVYVPGITSKQEVKVPGLNSLDGLNSSDFSHESIPGLTIPGLHTTVNAPFFDMGDNGDAAGDAWSPQVVRSSIGAETDVALERAQDLDSDSEDDLRIVLNNEYPYYGAGEKGLAGRQEVGSEDEDDEDLIIFTGGDPNEEGEEQLLQPPDVQVSQGDGSVHLVGDIQAGAEDGKGQQDKTVSSVALPGQAGWGYGYGYNSPYKYVRGGAAVIPGPNLGARVGLAKGGNGRGDWRGPGRGSFGLQNPGWPNYEFTLPPSMTVFDIDLESFEEKPWRQFDATDYFNFGFDEASWKNYCKQLVQLRLESTMQGKIRVYESGRSEQDYYPDLPSELAAVAGLPELADRSQQRVESGAASGISRVYAPKMPYGRPIEVEGSMGDRRPSSDLKKQRFRDSDSIVLIDAIEEEDDVEVEYLVDEDVDEMASEANKNEMDEEQQQQDEAEGPSMEDYGALCKAGPEQRDNEQGSKSMSDPMVSSTRHNVHSSSQGGRAAVATQSGIISGETPPTTSQTISKPLDEERRDLDQVLGHSRRRHYVESNPRSGTIEEDSYTKKHRGRGEQLRGSYISAEECEADQRGSHSALTSKEVHVRDKSPQEVQLESSGNSSKRQRLVSPECSHTTSWDNYDMSKPTRSSSYRKERRDSGESALDGSEHSQRYKRKSINLLERSREDWYKDSGQASESYHKKQGSTPSMHDSEREPHSYSPSLYKSRKRPMLGNIEENVSRDVSRHRKARERAYSQERDEEADRNTYSVKGMSVHNKKLATRRELRKKEDQDEAHRRDGGGYRLETRRKEQEKRRDRQGSRRRDDSREKVDRDNPQREREKEVDVMPRKEREKEIDVLHNAERQKKEDRRRKDRSKERSDHITKNEREKHAFERYDRETTRKREEESCKREKLEGHHRGKAHDGSTGDYDDSRQRSKEHQDPHARVRKNEEHSSQGGKGGKWHDDSRTSYGSCFSDSRRSTEPRSQPKDKRKALDDHGKDRSRLHEGRTRSTSDHEGLSLPVGHDRDSGKHDRLFNDPRTSVKKPRKDKHRFEGKRSKDLDKEPKDSNCLLEDHESAFSRERNAASKKNETVNKTKNQLEDLVMARIREEQSSVARAHPEGSKEPKDSSLVKISNKVRHSKVGYKGASEDKDGRQRGRSKLERWASHKDLEVNASQRLLIENVVKKNEKSRNSASKERQCHDDQKADNRQIAWVDSNAAKVSSSGEQLANGRVSRPDENGYVTVHLKDADAGPDEKDCAELPAQPQNKDPSLPKTNLSTKLEKGKERFKVSIEDADSSRKVGHEDRRSVDKDDTRQERPPRKRRWTSG